MKMEYEKPEVTIINFDNEDIVTTSGLSDLNDLGGMNETGFDSLK